MSRAPIISGTKKLPNPENTGVANRNIIVTPCIENSWLNASGPSTSRSGPASWVRISSDSIPPAAKKAMPV